MTGPVTAVPTGDVDLIGIRFRPGRAGAAFRTPMWELQDQLVEASGVLRRSDRLVDDLRNMAAANRLEYLCDALAGQFGSATAPSSSAVDHALAMIGARRGNVSIDRIARRIGITRRHLERKFRVEVGLGAKQMARISRVHAVLQVMQQPSPLSGAEIAAQCGYSDQPHMIRECRALTGHTPARLMTSGRSLSGRLRATL
jgi:transcriptional regulator GlxA family with amidase domain